MSIKEFYKENGFLVFKLIVMHVVMAIFGLMTYLPFNTETHAGSALVLISGIITMCFYYYLIRTTLWGIGASDHISSDAGRRKAMPLKGLYISLTAAIPDFLLCYIYVFFRFYESYEWAAAPAAVTGLITSLWEGAFLSVVHGIFNNSQLFFLAVPFIPVIFATLAYWLGTKEFSLFPQKKK